LWMRCLLLILLPIRLVKELVAIFMTTFILGND
jgi:hypothetical protein